MDVDTGSVQRTYKADPANSTFAASYNANQACMIVPQERSACLFAYSPTMQQPILRSFASERIGVTAVSPCSSFLIGGSAESGCVFVWSCSTGELLRIVKGHLRRVTCIACSSDSSLIATSSDDTTCKVWPLSTVVSASTAHAEAKCCFSSHTLGVLVCRFLNLAPHVVTGSADRSCRIFHAISGEQLLSINLDAPVTTIGVSPCDSRFVAGANNGTLHFIQLYLSSAQDEHLLPISKSFETERVVSCVGSDDGHCGAICMSEVRRNSAGALRAVVASKNGVVLEWDLDSKKVVRQIAQVKKGVSHACMVPNVTVDCMSLLSTALFVQLQKYPVDHQGQVGYMLVDYSAAATSAAAAAQKAALPNVKYNKKKQKRLREQLNQEAEDERLRSQAQQAERTRLRSVADQQLAKNEELRTLKERMCAQLLKLEASLGPIVEVPE